MAGEDEGEEPAVERYRAIRRSRLAEAFALALVTEYVRNEDNLNPVGIARLAVALAEELIAEMDGRS